MFTTRVNAINGNLYLIEQMMRNLPRMSNEDIYNVYNSLLDFIKNSDINEEEPKQKRTKVVVRIPKKDFPKWDHWTHRNIVSINSIEIKSPKDIQFTMYVSKSADGRSTCRAILVKATLQDIQHLKDGEESISFLNAFGLYIREKDIPHQDYSVLVQAITSIPWATARDKVLI